MGNPEPRDETATFMYLDWQDLYNTEKPFQIFSYLEDPNVRYTNLVFKDGGTECVHDVRGKESECTLDRNGFKFVRHQTSLTSFDKKEDIEKSYLPEIENLVRKHVDDAEMVFTFDWRVRRSGEPPNEKAVIDANDQMNRLLPAKHVHVDTSPPDILRIVRRELPTELLKRRVRAINAWRPIVDVVHDWPLALCDGSTVSSSDLVEIDHIRLQARHRTYLAKPNTNYRWNYLSHQKRDEVTLFKNFDSDPKVAAGCVPHTSFPVTTAIAEQDKIPRESIEVRLLIFSPLETDN